MTQTTRIADINQAIATITITGRTNRNAVMGLYAACGDANRDLALTILDEIDENRRLRQMADDAITEYRSVRAIAGGQYLVPETTLDMIKTYADAYGRAIIAGDDNTINRVNLDNLRDVCLRYTGGSRIARETMSEMFDFAIRLGTVKARRQASARRLRRMVADVRATM